MKSVLTVLTWVGKNLGLILGVAEIAVKAIVEIIAQVAKVLAGVANVFQSTRNKDVLVNWVSKLEAMSKWVDTFFTSIKAWLYSFGITSTTETTTTTTETK